MSQRAQPDPAPPPASQEAVVPADGEARRGGSNEGHVQSGGEDESYEPADPNPDTPDDFEEDVIPDRESIEAVTGDARDSDDDSDD
jgi:hypothetical protein